MSDQDIVQPAVAAPVEPVIEPVATEAAAPAEPVVEPKAESAEVVEPEQKQEHEKNRIQKRIDKLTREKYEAIAEAKAYKMMMEQQQPKQEAQADDRPTRAQYGDDESFIDALTDWKLNQREQVANKQREQETHYSRQQEWQKRVDVARQEYADFDDVIEDARDVPLHTAASRAILESDMSTDIQYYLAKHPEEAAATVKMSPERAASHIGRIEAKISADKASRASQPPAKKVSNAPAPVVPVKPVGGGSAHVNLNDPKLDINTWMRTRNTQLQT